MNEPTIVQTQVTVRNWPAMPSQNTDLGFISSGGSEPAYYVGPAQSAPWVTENLDRALRMMGFAPAVADREGMLRREELPPVAELVRRAGYNWHQLPAYVQTDLIEDWERAPANLSDGEAAVKISTLLAGVAPESAVDSEGNLRTWLHAFVRDADWEDLQLLEDCAKQLDATG